MSHLWGFEVDLYSKPRIAETKRRVRDKKPPGSEDSLCKTNQLLPWRMVLWEAVTMLTCVYHSIIRGNRGRGMVNAGRQIP